MKVDKIYLVLILVVVTVVFSWISSCTHDADISAIPEVCFTGDILPIFTANCAIAGCHDGGGEGHMALNNYAEIRQRITPGNPNGSELYKVIIDKWGNLMPPSTPLSMDNREKIRVWIEQGAGETTCADASGTNPSGNNYVARACFTRDVLPVVVSRCATAGCHDAISHKEGRTYTTYTNIRASVSPRNPAQSTLYQVITTTSGESKMPPTGSPQLTTAEKDTIRQWITYGALDENCGEVCDTINPVTFTATIWPIIQSSCTGCHSGSSPSGNVTLASYANVSAVAASGLLMNSLNGNGVTKMPVGTTFSPCRIRQFQIWVNNGYQNN